MARGEVREIIVFYHLFMVNEWQQLFEWHLDRIRTSGLYDACKEIRVGAVHEDHRRLSELDSVLRRHDKATLCFARELAKPPVLWSDPEVRLDDGRLGECETILRMAEHAQRHAREIVYLFIHSKGITNPPTKRRKHLPYLVSRGLDPSESNESANAFVLRDTSMIISNWAECVKALETLSFWYYLYNFFWVSGELLRRFDFEEYLRLHRQFAPPQQRTHQLGADWNTTRHLFSLFPIKLHAFSNGIKMQDPPYTYINVRK